VASNGDQQQIPWFIKGQEDESCEVAFLGISQGEVSQSVGEAQSNQVQQLLFSQKHHRQYTISTETPGHYHPPVWRHNAFDRIRLSVCMRVFVSPVRDLTFEILDPETSFSLCG